LRFWRDLRPSDYHTTLLATSATGMERAEIKVTGSVASEERALLTAFRVNQRGAVHRYQLAIGTFETL